MRSRSRLALAQAVLATGIITVLVQAMRMAPKNPPVHSDLVAPDEVKRILRGACYDCHSNETAWPWYERILPVSWMMRRDVDEGRRRLNFSEWAAYASDPETVAEKLTKLGSVVRNGDMAPWYYRMLHPHARLTAAQRETLTRWVAHEVGSQTSAR